MIKNLFHPFTDWAEPDSAINNAGEVPLPLSEYNPAFVLPQFSLRKNAISVKVAVKVKLFKVYIVTPPVPERVTVPSNLFPKAKLEHAEGAGSAVGTGVFDGILEAIFVAVPV